MRISSGRKLDGLLSENRAATNQEYYVNHPFYCRINTVLKWHAESIFDLTNNDQNMRKIKLQMTISIDGFVKSKFGGPDVWDNEVTDFCVRNLDNVDAILLGRSTAEGFVPYWKEVAGNPEVEYYPLGKPLTDIPKIVFSNTVKVNSLENTSIINGDFKSAIEKLKAENGKDIMVYGGVSFVSSLIQYDLIDEFALLYYPYAASQGDTIFGNLKTSLSLSLKTCRAFPCGIVLLEYDRNR